MTETDLAALSAHALAALIRARKVSASDAMQAAISRAEAANPVLNAVLAIDAEQALAAAAKADHDGRNDALPLSGVPLAHKDMFDRAGQIASWGAMIQADAPAAADATVIARLKAAGAIQFATLHMAEFAFGITGHNYQVGHCHNPHDPNYITGGSSSGSAASVAAGIVPFALGSDTGGSVRVPAACCGIVGLRPTWGLISRAGAMPLAPSLDAVGPLARDVADIALALSLLAGADAADGTAAAPPADYLGALGASPRGLRLGVDRSLLEGIDAGVAGLVDDALRVLTDAGAIEVPVRIPDLRQLDRYAQVLQFAEASAFHARWMRERPQDYSAQVRARLEEGYALSAADYLQAQRARPLVVGDWLTGPFAGTDVLVLPVLKDKVPTIADTDVGGGSNMAKVIGGLLHFTRPLSYLGVPCLTLPTGRDGRGLPNGIQLVARPYGEPTLLRLGAAYQATVGVPRPRPPLVP